MVTFHKYQQNEQLPLTYFEYKNDRDIWRWKTMSWLGGND
jgi:hypothetical protein